MAKAKLVVIGNGMAGMRTVEELLQSAPDAYEITVFGAEPYGNYNRILLSAVLSGDKTFADIVTHDRQWYSDRGITLYAGPGKEVVRIERGMSRVIARDGTLAGYDRLLIATGSKPVVPAIPGVDLAGVIRFRDIQDVNAMLAYSKTRRRAVVLGGGLLGLEAANGLAGRGMAVTVVHNHPVLLNRQLDPEAAAMLRRSLEGRGIGFKMAAQAEAVVGNAEGHVSAVRLQDGGELACDLLVLAAGVRPNIHLAREAGLYCERGIVVDDSLKTYDPCVYAVGECVQHRGSTFGLVAPVFEQARVCADHLSRNGTARYITLPAATKLKVTGINLFSVGDFQEDSAAKPICFRDPARGVYKKLVVKDGQIKGAVLFGDTGDGPWYQALIENGQNISGIRQGLIFGRAHCEPSA